MAQTGSLSCKMLRRPNLAIGNEGSGWVGVMHHGLGWDLRGRIEFGVARQSHWRCIMVGLWYGLW